MKYSLDTSVIVRLLTLEPADQLAVMVEFLEQARRTGAQIQINDLVVAETYFALQHHFGISKKKALWGLSELFTSGEIVSSGHAGAILSQPGLHSAKPGFVDRLLHAEAVHSQCKWVTFEKSAAKLPDTVILKIR